MLRAGGVVAFPTETVYGLGALAFDRLATARVFEIKQRPSFDPLIVHVLDEAMLERVVAGFPELARRLAARFWPGPLTLVLPKRPDLPDLVTAGLASVAVRMPAHPVARALLEAVGAPIAAPSANPFGALSPTRAEHVARGLGAQVDIVLDAGPSEHGLESTIVALDPPALLRPGALPLESVEEITGPLARGRDGAILAPGTLSHHYSPRTPLRLIEPKGVPAAERMRAGALDPPPRDRWICRVAHALGGGRPARGCCPLLRNAPRARRPRARAHRRRADAVAGARTGDDGPAHSRGRPLKRLALAMRSADKSGKKGL